MKKILLIFILFISAKAFSQSTETSADDVVFQKVEVESEFVGGAKAWREFVVKNLNPEVPSKNGAKKGKYLVVVRFTINKDGDIVDCIAETTKGFGMEEEVVRLIKKSPKWKPGMQNGRLVSSIKRQPITFVVE
jgi:periplasmic protein TonB